MQESIKKLVILVIHYYEEDSNEPYREMINKIIPCEDNATADAFENFYRNKYSDTQLCKIYRNESSVYKL